MKKAEKLVNQFCITVDEATAAQIIAIAEFYQRKPSELLRLILAPVLRDYWAKIQQQEHPENIEPLTVATFHK